jgi:hypothetical protein
VTEVVVVFAAPVPVGHRVEITWYEAVSRGLVPSQERVDEREHQPVLRDLDTGVEYATDWFVGASRRKRPDAPYEVGDGARAELREQRRVEGIVRRCRVVTIRGYPDYDVQTHLVLEP